MREFIIYVAEIMNTIHDVLVDIFGVHMTDKELHFWVIGIIGMVSFFVVYVFFKFIDKLKWSVTIFSFIYTFTGMVVLVFAIEIQQAITNRGNMEFQDAVAGLWGFILLFIVYAVISLAIYGIGKLIQKLKLR